MPNRGEVTRMIQTSTVTMTNKTLTAPVVDVLTVSHATTPYVATASGKTNTGYLQVNGKTSGAIKITCADATAYTLTINAAARTVGTATLTIPDTANVADTFAMVTLAQTLANKTLTAPIIGGYMKNSAVDASVAATGTNSAEAAALTADKAIVPISSDGASKGVKLPTGVAGMQITIINTSTTGAVLYPATGGTIDGLGANAGVVIAASKRYVVTATAADKWYTIEAAAATAV